MELTATTFVGNDRPRDISPDLDATAVRDIVAFGRQLVRSVNPEAAVSTAVAFCSEQLRTPAAGWSMGPGAGTGPLIAARGMTSSQRRALAVPPARARERRRAEALTRSTVDRFAKVTEAPHPETIDAGGALLVVADASTGQNILDIVRSLLPPTLKVVEEIRLARRLHSHLDTAMACVAHEIRGPLLASTNVIDGVLCRNDVSGRDLDLLRWSHEELTQLAASLDHLLAWMVSGGRLRRRRTDLVKVVEKAVGSVVHEMGQDRVSIRSPDRLDVLAASAALREAISNVLRNALTYSPEGSEVDVVVEGLEATARVSVHDRGRGVKESERDAIFEPFRRGEASRESVSGGGLGLFIARRVVEAHGGRILVRSTSDGATFIIELEGA